MHNVQWTPTAVKSYNNLIARTKSFELALDKKISTLETMPRSFPFDENYKLNRAVVNKRHILFYDIVPSRNMVVLILFFDTKADTEKIRALLN
ncbi:MAG: hypothetical protein JKY53_05935 [Flavobacteriales bacterium]|nr:hypothetical protein [Flavobacteriales bacterium]